MEGGAPCMMVQTLSMSRPPATAASAGPTADQEDSSSTSCGGSGPIYSEHPFLTGGSGGAGTAGDASPYNMSPWHHAAASPYAGSPWNQTLCTDTSCVSSADSLPATCLIGSLIREEGHIYSLAASGELLYTGSDSKNIRVWKNQKEFSGFKSSSGLVKAILIAGDKIFSGHQDGKIRVWRVSPKDPTVHKRVGSLPRLKDFIKCSLKPSNYVEVRKHRSALWIRHYDAISCLSFSEDLGLLYSGSWDKTFKVWRIADSKCLESVTAHDDAVNSVVAGFDGLVFTGSADGTVKVWRRELHAKGTKHAAVQTLLKQESAVTSLATSRSGSMVYSGSSDGVINLWEWERRGAQLAHRGTLAGHKLAVLCLAATGSLLLSGSADRTICVWRREGAGHTCLSVLSGHGGPVKCLAVVEDESSAGYDVGGRHIVYSGSLDKSVKVWRVSERAPDALLRGPQHDGL